jgi:hypothetical protein
MTMDSLAGYVATATVSVAAGYALQFLAPRAKVVFWAAHHFGFQVPALPPGIPVPVTLTTSAITVQNIGRVRAENIEVAHDRRPDMFSIYPTLAFTESQQQGLHIIHLPGLGPKEWFTLELLNTGLQPPAQFLYVRSRDGHAQPIPMLFQRALPTWQIYVGWAIWITGAGFLLYWIVRAVMSLLGVRS